MASAATVYQLTRINGAVDISASIEAIASKLAREAEDEVMGLRKKVSDAVRAADAQGATALKIACDLKFSARACDVE